MTELNWPVDSTQPAIVVSAYEHLAHALRQFEVRHCISLLGRAEVVAQRGWPEFGNRALLRLQFDDVQHSSRGFQAPSAEQIGALIRFARDWGGRGNLLIHCRAGTARSPAAAMIAAATLPQTDAEVPSQVVHAKTFFRPNTRMLELADAILQRKPTLIEILRSTSRPDRLDGWAPLRIPLA
jgi:predicted protein tyrosine phosphatase